MKTQDRARELFTQLQSKIMGEISHMLRTVKLTSLLDLAEESPTYTELAEELTHFWKVTHMLAPMIGVQEKAEALDPYIAAVTKLGTAIDSGEDDLLCEAIAELDVLPYT